MNNLAFIKSIRPANYFKTDYLYACYIALYQFAEQYCKDKVVLDAACGMGFGSYYLKQVADQVTGIDISKDALDHAIEKYQAEGLEFREEDATNTSLPDEAYDVIVSIETYEHIPPELAEQFISEMHCMLKPGGRLIISTPNSPIYSQITKTPDHVNEIDVDEFDKRLAVFFEDRSFYYQRKGVLENMKTFYSVVKADRFKIRSIIPRSVRQWINKFVAKDVTKGIEELLPTLKVHPAESLDDVKDAVLQIAVCRK